MNYLDAFRLVSAFSGGPPLSLLLGMSGTPDKLDVFLKAAAATRGRLAKVRTLQFNTLGQTLLTDPSPGETEVFVLFPWDLVPEADWRSGLPLSALNFEELLNLARSTVSRLARRPAARTVYVHAPIPPLFPDPKATARLEAALNALMADAHADLLPSTVFSLSSYLSLGSPFATPALWQVAEIVVRRALGVQTEPKKVLVTDLDNVMWQGVIGEDGFDGIRFRPEGTGYRHFVYQTFLAKLKREGALLAAVSRNDEQLAAIPFNSGEMHLSAGDFVAIVASYQAKSAQIRELARQLNLGLDAFVFVDDNPIEIEEVSAAIPELTAVRFPDDDEAVVALLDDLAALFARTLVTSEDAERTEMYRRRLEGMAPAEAEGADLTEFLQGLQMSLAIHDRSHGDRTRAVQLINKTNQFNLNGRRVSDEEVDAILDAGGRLYTCALEDRTGVHGEILSCLIDQRGLVRSLVMSCRVFQRRVEHAFFAWLGTQADPPGALDFARTPRNEPIVQFLEDGAFSPAEGGIVTVDIESFARAHKADVDLFMLSTPIRQPAERAG